MDRRSFVKISAGITGLLLSDVSNLFGDDKSQRPNIVLCMADDQGWGDVEYYGHKELQTPNLNELSKSGLRFDRFYAAAPVCSPTRASVMTGRHPNRMGCFQWGHTLRPQEITIAEVLKDAGYVTGHFGKWHIGSVRKGSPVNPGASGFDQWLSAPNYFDNDPVLSREGTAVKKAGESSMVTADTALEFIRKHSEGEQPFFAVVWFPSPHLPHTGSQENLDLYPDADKKQAFYAEITGIDRAVGKLRDELRYLGIEKNTIFWYCSDNGGLKGLSETGGRGHKGMLYEGGLRVPATIEWPGVIEPGKTTNMPCSTVDIYPTLLEILGLSAEKQPRLDGLSLLPLIEGHLETRPRPIGFWEYPVSGKLVYSEKWMNNLLKLQQNTVNEDEVELGGLDLDAAEITKQYPKDSFPGHSAWLDWPWKLHRKENEEGEIEYELYNLKNDPYEEKNIVDDNPAKDQELKNGLKEWLESVVDSMNGEDYIR
ncbi:MAG: sulfatase [Sedimentisphaeraceae bacterium JB056]